VSLTDTDIMEDFLNHRGRIGKHLLEIRCNMTSSEATRPIFPKIPLAAR